MLPIHKLVSKDTLRPAMLYFRVLDGEISVTDANRGLILPAVNVFGDCPISPDDHIYFKGAEWGLAKMDKAHRITREGLHFTALDKKQNVLGRIVALDAETFNSSVAPFPDLACVMPAVDAVAAVTRIVLNPLLLVDLAVATGSSNGMVLLEFTGETRAIKVLPMRAAHEDDFEGRCVLMPGISKTWSEKGPACKIYDPNMEQSGTPVVEALADLANKYQPAQLLELLRLMAQPFADDALRAADLEAKMFL